MNQFTRWLVDNQTGRSSTSDVLNLFRYYHWPIAHPTLKSCSRNGVGRH